MNQQETQTRLMEAITNERQRLASRRGFLTGAAKVAGGGALAMAALPATGGLRSVVAQDFADDLEILNFALTLERLEAFFYTEGLTRFEEGAFSDDRSIRGDSDSGEDDDENDDNGEDDDDEVSIYARLEEVRDHEQAHVETLVQTINDLGGTPVEEGEYDFGDAFDNPQAFLETAQALENTGVAAYLGAAPQISDPGLLSAAGSILAVEARHASYLDNLVGESPFPDAFEEALSRDEVLEIAGGFIVGEGTGADSDADATETPADAEATETPADAEATETPEDADDSDDDDDETEEPVETEEPEATEEPEETEEPEATEAPEETEEPEETETEETDDEVEVPPTSTP